MSDPKPTKRIKDPELLKRFRLEHAGESCEACGQEPGVDPDHEKLRSQGGDDVAGNLRWLGRKCHRARHGNPWVDESGKRWDAAAVREALDPLLTL